ncbi:hypothetical protein B0H34DRAFT_368361 [Crassisporium funariophilum]|nr:hypothetical protein B0H34DRAFT_368361 [Crassisporium funariophilum]
MPFSYRQLFLGGTTFCCCLPVRMGVISMTILGCLVAGLLTVILWFEISSTKGMSGSELAAFILAALTETILFGASIFGLVGAMVRKQLFTQIYAYILYVHFVLNLGVAAYFLYEITRVTNNAKTLACETAIQDPEAQDQCTGLISIARWVFFFVAAIVLFVEMYGAIIVTRYLNQLKREKGAARASRLDTEEAFQLKKNTGYQYSRLLDPPTQHILPPIDRDHLGPSGTEYNPYEETMPPSVSRGYPAEHLGDDYQPMPPTEAGYGGGSWTHDVIASEEKAKLKQQDQMDVDESSYFGLTDEIQQRLDTKVLSGAPTITRNEQDLLPMYTTASLRRPVS